MGWLKGALAGALKWIIEQMLGGLDAPGIMSIAKLNPSGAGDGAPSWMATVWEAASSISKDISSVIGWSLLTLFLLLELSEVLRKQDLRNSDGIFSVAMVILKIGIAKMVMENITLIIGMVFGLMTTILNSSTLSSLSVGSIDTKALTEGIKTAVSNENDGILLLYLIFGMTMWLGSVACSILSKLVLYTRFIELYVFVAIAPVPVATCPSHEYSNIFKNWVKRLCAIALHAVLIVMCVYMYSAIIGTILTTDLAKAGILSCIMQILTFQLVLVVALFQTGGWAKSIATAN